jgi:hypothetical protein
MVIGAVIALCGSVLAFVLVRDSSPEAVVSPVADEAAVQAEG